MCPASHSTPSSTRSHTPRAFTVFAAAFVAGAAAAVAVNSVLDVRLAQSKPQVESEPIFVALRSLPQGAPVTVWDVALRDWPRAMVPTSALRSSDAFSGLVLKHPLREGQPLLSIQLVEAEPRPSATVSVTAVSTPSAPEPRVPDADLWAPAEPSVPAPVTAMPAQDRPSPEQHQQIPATQQAALPQPQPDAQAARGVEQPSLPAPATSAATTAVVESGQDQAAPSLAAAVPTTTAVPTETGSSAPFRPMPADAVATTITPAVEPIADSGTDESLEAMVATITPAVEAFVVSPGEDAVRPRDDVAAAPVTDAASGQSTIEALTEEALDPAVVAPGDAVAAQPAATPTLADPPLAPIIGEAAGGEPAAPASVMRQPTAEDTDATPVPVAPPPRVATRYLVVPESIALQADASFAAPRQTTPQPAPQPAPQAAAETVKPLPPSSAGPGRPQPAQQRASQPRRGTSAAVPAKGQTGQRPATPQAAAQQPRRGMFPNIAAGIESIEGEMERMRRDRAGQPEPAAAPRPRPQY